MLIGQAAALRCAKQAQAKVERRHTTDVGAVADGCHAREKALGLAGAGSGKNCHVRFAQLVFAGRVQRRTIKSRPHMREVAADYNQRTPPAHYRLAPRNKRLEALIGGNVRTTAHAPKLCDALWRAAH